MARAKGRGSGSGFEYQKVWRAPLCGLSILLDSSLGVSRRKVPGWELMCDVAVKQSSVGEGRAKYVIRGTRQMREAAGQTM